MQHLPFLRTLNAALVESDRTPDSELLRRYLAAKDDVAFELLLRRHAELVWNVCRSILRDDLNAAEDAFQATFVALARHAGKIDRPNSLGAWLFRVARFASLRSRRRGARDAMQALPESSASPAPAPEASAATAEQAVLVAEEVDRLPERFRLPVVLCFFQGYTQTEAADRLGWSAGTVASRIARAKERLRLRLSRRGVALGVSITAMVTAAGPVTAQPALIRACVLQAVGERHLPNHILSLSTEVLSAMTRTKYKWALASAVLAAGVSITGGWALGFAQQPAPEGPALAVPKPERQAAARDTPPSLTFPVRAEAAAGAAPEDKSREASALQRAYSQRNLRQIALAVLAYQKEHGCLPTDILDKDGKPLLSWRVAVLPYMEQKALYRLFKLDEPWDSEANKFLLNTILKLYANALENPLDAKGVFVTRVKRFTGANTLHQPGKNIDVNVTPDGIANTLLLAEVGDPVPWTKPGDPVIESVPDKLFTPKDPPVWKGPYTNVVNVAFADGVAASLKPDLTQEIVARLIYWNDGMALPGREGLEAVIPAAQQEEEIKNALLKLKQLADSYQAMCEEESKLLGEIGKLKKDPPDAAARLSERLMDLDVNLRNLTNEVRSLQTQIEKLKNEKK